MQHVDQLDLFGEIKAGLHGLPGGTQWAYSVWRDGLRIEPAETWGGWFCRPRWCIAWSELHAMRDARPDVTERLAVLAEGHGLPWTLGWRWWMLPFALDPCPWHPSYYASEQRPDYYDSDARPQAAWDDRIAAWRLVLDAVTATTLRVEVHQ
ncbi:MAG: hypothetical protein QM708_12160 [Propioniciclava sp.]|uniref:hypothetical protein n=1 Tax=Propioniciclava sp. TaxID=2038686 RepID=UPI0039E407E5